MAWSSLVLTSIVCVLTDKMANAQWVQQQVELVQGWNSIFLEVDPWPADADTLFNGLPLESVWMRAEIAAMAGTTNCPSPDDPGCVPPDDSGWRTWVPSASAGRSGVSLGVIRGNRAYLIKATSAFEWNVVGRPSGRPTSWQVGFNHVGFFVDDASTAPTFSAYLAPFITVQSQSVFSVNPDGGLSFVADAASVRTAPGVGYWIKSASAGKYDGPVRIDLTSMQGVEYAKNIVEHALTLDNLAGSARALRMTYGPSASPPSPSVDHPALAGDVPLRFWDFDTVQQVFVWRNLVTQVFSISAEGQPGSRRVVRVAVHREGLPVAQLDGDGHGSQYQGILTVTDGQGFRRRLPVSAQVPGTSVRTTVAGEIGADRAGLYVGTATIHSVSWATAGARTWVNSDPNDPQIQPGATEDRTTPRPTSSEFVFPIIIHLDDSGVYRMLHEVTLMWRPADPQSDTRGAFALVTPECPLETLAMLEAGSLQDGEPFSKRLSSAAFFFTDAQDHPMDLTLTGTFGNLLQGTTILRGGDRLNPFRHRYHPDHDCNEADECFDVTRIFTLTFDNNPAPADFRPGYNDGYFRGSYGETITGLHRESVFVRGTFDLARVSRVGRLNAQ